MWTFFRIYSFKIFVHVKSKYLSPMVWGFQSSSCSAYFKRRSRCNLITGNRNFIVEKRSDSRGLRSCWQNHPEILLKLDIVSWNTIVFLCSEVNGAYIQYKSTINPGSLVSAVLCLWLTEMSQPRGITEGVWLIKGVWNLASPRRLYDGPFCAQNLWKI